MNLQQALTDDGDANGYSIVTGYFGPLTERALQRFQARYSIVSGGTPEGTGYGAFGPRTRAFVNGN